MLSLYLIIVIVILYLYYILTKNKNYWKKKGVKFEKQTMIFGRDFQKFMKRITYSDSFVDLYKLYPNEKYVGFFTGNVPALLLRDPDIIKHVLIADFKNFHYRGLGFGKNEADPLLKTILTTDGDFWKLMRQKLTPAFSSGKIKAMFPLLIKQAEKLNTLVEQLVLTGKEIDVRELMSRYTTDFIGACVFGIDTDALLKESSDFRNLGKRIVTLGPRQAIAALLKRWFPNFFKNIFYFDPSIKGKIIELVTEMMARRNYKPSTRNDFIDIMLELRQKRKVVGESIEEFNADGAPKSVEIHLDDTLLAAQLFIFFAAGFETSAFASSTFLHILAYHPEIQARCQQEIDEVLTRHEGNLNYDSLKEMKYLEMSFKESIRLSPSPTMLTRVCVNKSTLPGTNLTLDNGSIVYVSLEGIQLDDKYFDDPEEYRPERFHPDNINNISKNTYIPFGTGPRSCIGERLGMVQSMTGVVTILKKFTVVPSINSIRQPRFKPFSGLIKDAIGGLPLTLQPRK